MVFTADYLRNISTHTCLTVDTNHVGDARFLNMGGGHDCYRQDPEELRGFLG